METGEVLLAPGRNLWREVGPITVVRFDAAGGWRRVYGEASEAPSDERDGNR